MVKGFVELEQRQLKSPFPAPSWGIDPYWLFLHPQLALAYYLLDKQFYFQY